MGPGGCLVGTRYSPPTQPPQPHYPGYTLPLPRHHGEQLPGPVWRLNSAVGLISVEQLSLSTQFSGFRGMTEVYNVAEAGNPDDHLYIVGFD